jgi:hypothetical protein
MSRSYWRLVARLKIVARYGWRVYKEVDGQAKRPGRNKQGVDFWDIHPGVVLKLYIGDLRIYEFDSSGSGIVNAWPRRFFDVEDEALGPSWHIQLLADGKVVKCDSGDLGILPYYYNQEWNDAFSLIVGRGRPNPDAPFREVDLFPSTSYREG